MIVKQRAAVIFHILNAGNKGMLLNKWKQGERWKVKQKDIKADNEDNSPTVPQERRVVPLLMVWSSRCGGHRQT